MAADWKAIMRTWDDLKSQRLTREAEWQQIADIFMPRKDFSCTPVPGQLRTRRVTTSVPQKCLSRFAAMLVGYMIDPTRPFIKPNVARGLVAAGRGVELDDASRDYLDGVSWSVFDRMMLPQSGFFGSVSRVALELGGFGSGVLFTGTKRGFGPKYQARPLRACWFAANEDGEVDTLYFEWSMPAWRVGLRYPKAAANEDLAKLIGDDKTASKPVKLLHAVEPRQHGRAGAVATNKPFASVVIAPEFKGAILEESGYESFPYAVPRLKVEEGSVYGTGLAWDALPDALVLNDLQRSVERGVAGRADPPMMVPNRLFAKTMDRRAGALNIYDESALGFQQLKDAIQFFPQGGDVGIGGDYMKMLEKRIEETFLTDWMTLRDSSNVTAEEIIERRQLRLRAMSAFVPSVDRDLMGAAADRTLEAMAATDQLAPPPEALSGVEVDWDYAGPLAIAQQQGQVDTIRQLFQLAAMARDLDEASVAVLAVDEGLRAAADAMAAPVGVLRSREATAELQSARQQQQQDMADAEIAAKSAAALRDAGQGAGALVAADQMQSGAGRAAA
jgi:Bacteriophage head to tail connecting protein